MTRHRSLPVLVALLAVLLLGGACSSKSDVGNDDLLKGIDSKTGNTRLGETTTTTAAKAPTTVGTTPQTTRPPTTQAVAPAIEVTIASDATSGGQFQPRVARVPAGSVVRFVNRDSKARSVVSDNSVFDSGPIAPGGKWDWVAQGAGQYNYSDGTRPYAVGTIDVV